MGMGMILGIVWDPTINLGQVITILGGVATIGRLLFSMQNLLRDHSRDLKELAELTTSHETRINAHNEWLIRAGLDRRRRIAIDGRGKEIE